MCPECCGAPCTPVCISDDEPHGGGQVVLVPKPQHAHVPTMSLALVPTPSRALAPVPPRAHQAWQVPSHVDDCDADEVEQLADQRMWTMPGDAAAAKTALGIAASLDVPSAARGGQRKNTITKKTQLATLAKNMRLQKKSMEKKKKQEKAHEARILLQKRLLKKTGKEIGEVGAATIGHENDVAAGGVEAAEEAAKADDAKVRRQRKPQEKKESNSERLAHVPLRLPCRMSVRRTVKGNEQRNAYILDGEPGQSDRYVIRISESQTPQYESIVGMLVGIINAGGGPASRVECKAWFENHIAEDIE